MLDSLSRVLALLTMGVAALAIWAGPAVSKPPRRPSSIVYRVTYEGSGSFSVNEQSGNGQYFSTAKADFHWKFTYPLTIRRPPGPPYGFGRRVSGGGDWSLVAGTTFGGGGCSSQGPLEPASQGSIESRMRHGGAVIVSLVPGLGEDFATVGGSSGQQFCDGTDFWRQWVFAHVDADVGRTLDPLTAIVKLSPAQQHRTTVTARVGNVPRLTVSSDCGSGNGHICTQSFQWTGTVTFRRVR